MCRTYRARPGVQDCCFPFMSSFDDPADHPVSLTRPALHELSRPLVLCNGGLPGGGACLDPSRDLSRKYCVRGQISNEICRQAMKSALPDSYFCPISHVSHVHLSPLVTSRRTQNMRESAMGRSKRKRSSRVSSGGGSMRASHGLGPLQEVCV